MNISETAIITNIPLFIEQACQEINRLRTLVAELQAQLFAAHQRLSSQQPVIVFMPGQQQLQQQQQQQLQQQQICLRSFSRDENLKILSKMPLTTLFKDLTKVAKIEKSWRDFYEICMALMQNEWTPEKIKEKTKTWLKTLCKEIYYDAIATLYMHELQAHMHQFVELHGDVNKFNCQLLEKRNHSNSKNIFQSTNLHTNLSEKDDCLVQLLNKNNRTDYLNRFDEPEVKKRVISNKRKSNFIENFRAKKTF